MHVRVVLGWVGVLALCSVGVVVDVSALFPGWVALWPIAAATLVLVAGTTGRALAVDRLLTSAMARHVGRISYPLYLWHWPVLVYYLIVTERTVPSVRGGCYILAASLLLAELTHRWVDRPLRRREGAAAARRPASSATSAGRPLRVTALWLSPALAACVLFTAWTAHETRMPPLDADDPRYPGALALAAGYDAQGLTAQEPLPRAAVAGKDWFRWGSCEVASTSSTVQHCRRPGHPTDAVRRVLVVGDSHAQQIGAALAEHTSRQGFELDLVLKGACALTTDPAHLPRGSEGHAACSSWNDSVFDDIVADPPDLVVTIGSRSSVDTADETVPAGYREAWARITARGIPVLAIRDNPRSATSPNECVVRRGAGACARPLAAAYPVVNPLEAATRGMPLVDHVDLQPYVCDERVCPPVIGNMSVYLDSNHLTATYARSMAPMLDEVLRQKIEWWN